MITARPLPYEDGVPSEGPVSLSRSDDGRKWGDYGKWGVIGGGVAWPSGHTSSHMALASSLVAFYRDETWLPFVAYPLVATMGLAMVEGDHHWFSDVVAGALIGHAIGWTVGSNMRRKYDAAHGKPTDDASAVHLHPVVSRDTLMLVLSL
jgi:membrane-associated phospholipid phosphatase